MSARHAPFSMKSRRVLLPDGREPVPAVIAVRDGKIESITTSGESATIDAGSHVILPGVVDTHVHINEPGRTEWEGFQTATRAAAAGGTTTLIDMPLNSIPATTTLAALEAKTRSARGACFVDYGFWGGVVPGNTAELEPMVRAGVRGFKCFLIESGVDEFPMVREDDLREAMPILASAGVPLLVHAELDCGAPAAADACSYGSYLESRPPKWEVEAIRMMIRLSAETGCRVHIVHLSAADALTDLAAARARGVPITAETCPHYLTIRAEEIPNGATHFKCAPPIRENDNRERLWKGLTSGTIDLIVSDHSPCTPALKKLETGHFGEAWGGISGLQFSLSVIWTEMRRRGLSIAQLSHWMSAAPARLAGLENRKGKLAAGFDADFVVFDAEKTFRLERAMVRHKHSLTPYEGRELCGKVEKSYVRGVNVYDGAHFTPGGDRI